MLDFGDKTNLLEILECQLEIDKKYKSLSSNELLLLRRSINTAYCVITAVENISFEKLQLALYIKTKNKTFINLIKHYEYQIEGAKINRKKFVDNIHSFYMHMAKTILDDGNIRIFFEFLDFIIRHSRKTEYEKIFNAYVSLLMQQCCYFAFLQNKSEEICCGITSDNEILYTKDPVPYSDCASYEITGLMYKALKNNKMADFSSIQKAYKKWGYNISSMDDITALDSICRSFANNNNVMIPYINEHTKEILSGKYLSKINGDFPRIWMNTETYEEKLNNRKYTLPSNGIYAKYKNAGDFNKILFQEIYKDDRIILLYKITLLNNEEFSGYYDTSDKEFYSVYLQSNLKEFNKNVKNFILENYYILTCENDIYKKRNYMIKQVESIDDNNIEYPYQIFVELSYKKTPRNKQKNKTMHHYDRTKYVNEKKSINGFIRKLPVGQFASEEAKSFAKSLGYNLNEEQTFVKPFQKNILKIKL